MLCILIFINIIFFSINFFIIYFNQMYLFICKCIYLASLIRFLL